MPGRGTTIGARGPRPRPFECREDLFWYLVGLIATDGCLSGNGRTVCIVAKDPKYLERLRNALALRCTVRPVSNGRGQISHRLQIGSRVLYDKLLAIGLTPRKSLTLGRLDVPDMYFDHFMRGVIDGDGNIRRWRHPTNGHEQWVVRVYGSSQPFLSWIRETIQRLWVVEGKIHEAIDATGRRHPRYTLKFGKLAARVILSTCYVSNALALDRKAVLAAECLASSVGWSNSQTVKTPGAWRTWVYAHHYPRRVDHSGHVSKTDGM